MKNLKSVPDDEQSGSCTGWRCGFEEIFRDGAYYATSSDNISLKPARFGPMSVLPTLRSWKILV